MTPNMPTCPNCDAILRDEDINVKGELGKCDNCESVFELKIPSGTDYQPKQIVRCPKGVEYTQSQKDLLEIIIKWRNVEGGLAGCLLFSLLVVGGVLLLMTFIMIKAGAYLGIFFFIPFVLFSIPFIQIYLHSQFNYTHIKVDQKNLLISQKPYKDNFHNKDFQFPVEKIEQVYVSVEYRKTKNGITKDYFLNVKLKDGNKIKVIKNFNNLNIYRYLEQEVERFLEIKDEIVSGEYRGKG